MRWVEVGAVFFFSLARFFSLTKKKTIYFLTWPETQNFSQNQRHFFPKFQTTIRSNEQTFKANLAKH